MTLKQQTGAIISSLLSTPTRVDQATAGWDTARLRAISPEGQHSAASILAHIRANDDIQNYRAYMIMARENPPLPSFNMESWAATSGYLDADFHTSLETFRLRRNELVAMLRRLSADDWQRSGTHEIRGSVTLLEIINYTVEQEELLCSQLETLVTQLS